MSIAWRVVPIERWPGEPTRNRKEHPFSSTVDSVYGPRRARTVDWSGTTQLLEKELRALGAKEIILQMAVTERECRNDGWIRSDARPSHPGVILSFESKFGPLSYPCDQFRHWQANVRAIALALEALRKVDRYGVTKRGEQYTGWGKLPPAGGSTSTMTAEVAARVLIEAASFPPSEEMLSAVLADGEILSNTYRTAAKRTHPDVGGSTREFQLVQEAKGVLDRHHGARP